MFRTDVKMIIGHLGHMHGHGQNFSDMIHLRQSVLVEILYLSIAIFYTRRRDTHHTNTRPASALNMPNKYRSAAYFEIS